MVSVEEEEEPGGEDGEEDDEREGVPEKAEEENEEENGGVVNAEMVKVALQAVGGFGDGVRGREGLEGEEVVPWTARGVVGGCVGAWGEWGSWSWGNGRHWITLFLFLFLFLGVDLIFMNSKSLTLKN